MFAIGCAPCWRCDRAHGTLYPPLPPSQFFSELPFHLISPVVLGTIVYWLAHLRDTFQHFAVFMTIITLESIAAVAVGMAIRCVPPARWLL